MLHLRNRPERVTDLRKLNSSNRTGDVTRIDCPTKAARGTGQDAGAVPAISTSENWKPVLGHPKYEVSDLGRVRSLDMECRFGNRHWIKPGQMLKPQRQKLGYLHVNLAGGHRRLVHHLVLEAFVGPRPEGMETLHANDVRDDNRLENLSWGTHQRNLIDASERLRFPVQSSTHCRNGHEFTTENTYLYTSGGRPTRCCRTCGRLRARKYRGEKNSGMANKAGQPAERRG